MIRLLQTGTINENKKMDGGRKPKRRIIDNTSVPISRRVGQKRSESRENINQNTEDTTQTSLVRNSSSRDKTDFGNSKQNSAFLKMLENSSDAPLDQTDDLDHRLSEVSTLQQFTSVESNDRKEIVLGKAENESLSKPGEVKERLNAEEKHSEIDKMTIQDDNKTAGQSDTVILEQVEIESEKNPCTSIRCLDKTDGKPIVELQKADVVKLQEDDVASATDNNNRMHENQEISEKTDDLAPNKLTSFLALYDVKCQIVKENDCFSCREKEDESNSFLESDNELNIRDGQIDPLYVLGQSECKGNDGNVVLKNPLFSIQEETPNDPKSHVFETKNILTDMDKIAEHNFVEEMIKSDIELQKPDINLCQFFGEDDELSSIRNVSSVGHDLLEDNLVCHTGLSLFDEPNVIKESSKYFQFNLLEANECQEIQEHKVNLFVSPGTKDPFSVELELTTPLDDKVFEQPGVSMADLYEAVVHGVRKSPENDTLNEEEETKNKVR